MENIKPTKKKHICVCICTYKRHVFLESLLEKIKGQECGHTITHSIVVVDNDINESAKKTVVNSLLNSPIKIKYFVEPQQSIARARNKAILVSQGEYLAFIDDDEFPPNNWLLTLLECIENVKADGVLGPVLPFYQGNPPQWLINGRFCDRPRHPTGYVLSWDFTRTGNVLIKRNIIDTLDIPFRLEFSSGGEDKDFFRRLIENGFKFKWCDEAPVYEYVPPIRWNRIFMIKRALLRGKTSIGHPRKPFLSLLKSLVAIFCYSISLPFLIFFGQHIFIKYLISACDHIGRILAILKCNPIKKIYIVD